ncbi:MAG: glycosyltransferase [Pyrinomonadaceae bacterium]
MASGADRSTGQIRRKLSRVVELWREGGAASIALHARWALHRAAEQRRYEEWMRRSDEAARSNAERCQELAAGGPLLSVILPVYNIDERYLRRCIDSVIAQTYPRWELCIADDRSTDSRVRAVLEEFLARGDERIKVIFREENGHISAASNSALELATGEFCVLLDHDDELSPDALCRVADEVRRHPDAKMIYSDEDLIDEHGRRSQPKFKPDLSRDLMLSLNLVTHLSAYETSLLREIGGFRIGFEGSQDYDLALRVVERISDDQVRHIPRVLYHWRAIEGSVALSSDEKPYAHERARDAIREHLERTGASADVEQTHFNLHRVRYRLPEPRPAIEVYVFGPNAREAADRIGSATEYSNAAFHPVVIAGSSVAAELDRAAVEIGSAELICFVNAALEPLAADWLEELARFAVQPQIGAAGAKLLDRSDRVVDGPLVIGAGRAVAVAHRGLGREMRGNMVRNMVAGNFSAVSANCMMTRRELFRSAGGFDREAFGESLFDADYCLRLREEKGCRIVFDPYAEMRSRVALLRRRASAAEIAAFERRWANCITHDPFYNPNLSRRDASFSIDPRSAS